MNWRYITASENSKATTDGFENLMFVYDSGILQYVNDKLQ